MRTSSTCRPTPFAVARETPRMSVTAFTSRAGAGAPHNRSPRACRQLATPRARAAPGQCAAVVKANAYGIGIEQAGPALWAAGARLSSSPSWPKALRPGRSARRGGDLCSQRGRDRTPIPADYAGMAPETRDRQRGGTRTLGGLRGAPRAKLPCAIHLDTGMRRLGFDMLGDLERAMARHGELPGGGPADEPFCRVRNAGRSYQRARRSRCSRPPGRPFHICRASLANSSGAVPARSADL